MAYQIVLSICGILAGILIGIPLLALLVIGVVTWLEFVMVGTYNGRRVWGGILKE